MASLRHLLVYLSLISVWAGCDTQAEVVDNNSIAVTPRSGPSIKAPDGTLVQTETGAGAGAQSTLPADPAFAPKAAVLKGSVVVPTQGQTASGDLIDAKLKLTAKPVSWEVVEKRIAEAQRKIADDLQTVRLLNGMYDELERPRYTESESLEQHIERLEKIRAEYPDSPTPLVVLGGAYVHFGWEARGTGFANTVTADGWQLFQERVDRGQQLLEQALEMGVKDSRAHQWLVTVAKAKGLPKEQAQEWVADGQKFTQLDLRLYSAMADYLQVKWHGQPGDVEQFANEIVKDIPGDNKYEVFGSIVANANCSDFGMVLWGGLDRKNMAGAVRVFLKNHGDSPVHMSFAGLMAWVIGDQKQARRALKYAKGKLDPAVFATDHRVNWFQNYCNAPKLPGGAKKRIWGSLNSPRGMAFASDSRHLWLTSMHHQFPVHSIDTQTGKVAVRLPAPSMAAYKLSVSGDDTKIVAPCTAEGFPAS